MAAANMLVMMTWMITKYDDDNYYDDSNDGDTDDCNASNIDNDSKDEGDR